MDIEFLKKLQKAQFNVAYQFYEKNPAAYVSQFGGNNVVRMTYIWKNQPLERDSK